MLLIITRSITMSADVEEPSVIRCPQPVHLLHN
ncbi:hypothetical protein VSVS05_03381 [Vibrio scophthalmi]|uniref:Uncharacterized protein n=1 Tax=Vibrio scophthalmi TaxID=45658 RepID=A0A1C7FHE9_9VIBR|nr:hypothetical protein VSVS05_03381 [Vibrio scophthalmi]